jgi:serine/threonine protein kinase
MNKPNAQQVLLDAVAEEFAARYRQGDRPSVEEYAARYPEAAREIRELLPSVVLLERLKPPRSPGGRIPLEPAQPQQLGDYRIVREVGRGGMGIVYEAVQQSLGRRVALKLLPHHTQRDINRLERFRLEAQAAARLHHTNIVPVFGLFESDGLHYYVMQFIDGHGLDAVSGRQRGAAALRDTLPRLKSTVNVGPVSQAAAAGHVTPPPIVVHASAPTAAGWKIREPADEFRQAARIGVQVAQALDYAHAQGILHRDIKPANLLLDQQGTVWVTDFGLAKLREADGLTATGDLVGTLQYMAPEALHGQSGPQSDVYSLGLTLLELMTHQAPFPESSPARLIKQISEHEPIRPRLRNPLIPRDLETIVLKAIAREPRDRYATAGALAGDLSRFLEDRPITARRSSSLERFWRWSRRNRALASSLAAALGCLVLATIVGWWAYASTTQALVRADDKRQEAERATRRAKANMQLSLQALEEIFAALAPPDDELRGGIHPPRGPEAEPPPREPPPREHPPGAGPNRDGEPGKHRGPRHEGPPGAGPAPHRRSEESEMEQRRSQLLHAVLSFYERFAQQNEADPNLQSEAAKGQRRVGEIHARLGEQAQARQALDRSVASFAALVKAFPQRGDYLAGLADAYLAQAALERDAGDPRALLSAADRTQAAGDRLLSAFADNNAYQAQVAAFYGELGKWLQDAGELAAAEKFYLRAVPAAQRLAAAKFGRPGGAAEDLAALYGRLAALQMSEKRSAEATATLEQAIDLLLHQRRNPKIDRLLEAQYLSLAEITSDPDRAAELRRKARQALDGDRPRDGFEGSGRRPPPPPPPFFGPPNDPPPKE